jgi:hypothetical protein
MKKLAINQMEMTKGGDFNLGCAWLGWAAGLASVALGPVSLAVGAATYYGCALAASK